MMTYNRANNSISEAYTSIYNKPQKRYITESSETKSSLSDVEKAYAPLFNLMDQSPDMGRQVFATIVQQLKTSEQKSLCKQFGFEYLDAFNLIQQLTNYFYKGLNINPEKKQDFYTKIIPILESEVIVNIIKHDYLIDIPVYKVPSTTTTNSEDNKTQETQTNTEETPTEQQDGTTTTTTSSSSGNGDQSNSMSNNGTTATTTTNPTSGNGDQSNPSGNTNAGDINAVNNNEKTVKKVTIPANIDSDTINYYKEELDKVAKKSMSLRKRILDIMRLQSEYIKRFRGQNANQTAQYQQYAAGNGGYGTRGTVFLQGQQNPNTYQHTQQPQQQSQGTPKKDEEEGGFLSNAWNGLKKVGGGVLGGAADIADGAMDLGKAGVGAVRGAADYLRGK